MSRNTKRTPRNYDGPEVTTHRLTELLPNVLSALAEVYNDRPDLILAAWPEIIGSKLSTMTQAVSFSDHVLTVKVKNSTLYSLLNQHDKLKILRNLQQKFPKANIRNIMFRIG